MELVWFTLVGVSIYLFANGILARIELWRGERLKNRGVAFFAIFMPLALGSFELIQYLMRSNGMPS